MHAHSRPVIQGSALICGDGGAQADRRLKEDPNRSRSIHRHQRRPSTGTAGTAGTAACASWTRSPWETARTWPHQRPHLRTRPSSGRRAPVEHDGSWRGDSAPSPGLPCQRCRLVGKDRHLRRPPSSTHLWLRRGPVASAVSYSGASAPLPGPPAEPGPIAFQPTTPLTSPNLTSPNPNSCTTVYSIVQYSPALSKLVIRKERALYTPPQFQTWSHAPGKPATPGACRGSLTRRRGSLVSSF